jgi:uncharacterized protein (DUF736 family)
MLFGHMRATQPLFGLIWPKDGCTSIAYAATAAGRLSSPGLRPFLARQESLAAAILRCASARRRVRRRSPSASQIAIEAAMVAGSKTARRNDMANIGTFKKVNSEYQGDIVTLGVQAKGVRIVPESNRTNEDAPSHRVFVGRAEIGAAWSKRSNEGRDYLSLKLDDPSFTAPIYANLFDDEGGNFTLIWSRSRKQNGE